MNALPPQASAPKARALPGRAAQMSTRAGFFIAGFALAAWAPLVPFAKARAGLDDAGLGLVLLCLGIGSIAAMLPTGPLAARFGVRLVITCGTLALAAAAPVLASTASVPLLALALAVFGAGLGMVDVAINIQAVIVEKASGRAMMSGFHGLFSVGGIAGAGGAVGLLSLGLPPVAIGIGVAVVALALLAVAWPHLLPYGGHSGGPLFVLPRGFVLFVGALCFAMFLAEGAVLDWSAVFLVTVRGVEPTVAGIGYAAFAVAMTVGRLTGDRIVSRLGPRRVLQVGGVCTAAGFLIATLSPSVPVAVVGYGLVGLGAANIVPVLFTAAGRHPVMPPSLAVAAITTIGYAGVLAGPALIGFVAQATSLPAAFLGLAVLTLAVAAAARRATG
jgi:predicted MFS family arabinose efflux permease